MPASSSQIGAHYRHTTPEMAAPVTNGVEQRLAIVLRMAEAAIEQPRTGQGSGSSSQLGVPG
jgi:hypothetical protein